MRFGINALYLIPGEVGGSEIYLRALIASLARADDANEYYIFRNAETSSDLVPDRPNFHDCPQPVRARSRPARIAYEQTVFIREMLRYRLDVLVNGGYTAPLLSPIPMITVVYDLQYLAHPQYARWFDRPIWATLMPASARRSHRILTISRASKAQIEHFYPWAIGRIDIVSPGVDRDFEAVAERRARDRRRAATILTVSTLHPHKNLDTLVRAFAPIAREDADVRLIVCGLKGFSSDALLALRAELGLTERVVFTGWIERSALLDHFANAAAFAFPSKFEGFGIPVLEALTAGVPVVCSDIPPLREIAGPCATYFDPADESALTAALRSAMTQAEDPIRIAAGCARAATFSWDAGALRLRGILEAVATSARRGAPRTATPKRHRKKTS